MCGCVYADVGRSVPVPVSVPSVVLRVSVSCTLGASGNMLREYVYFQISPLKLCAVAILLALILLFCSCFPFSYYIFVAVVLSWLIIFSIYIGIGMRPAQVSVSVCLCKPYAADARAFVSGEKKKEKMKPLRDERIFAGALMRTHTSTHNNIHSTHTQSHTHTHTHTYFSSRSRTHAYTHRRLY